MMKTLRLSLAIALCLALLLTGCSHKTNTAAPAAPVSVDIRLAQYNQIAATANSNLVQVVVSLKDAGVLSAANAARIALYQDSVAKATSGIAQILQSQAPLADKLIQVQNLGLSLVPPSGYQAFGVQTDVQFQALVTAIDGLESTIKIIVQMAQVPPAAAK